MLGNSQGDDESRATGKGLVWLIGAVVCLCAGPRVHAPYSVN